MTKQEIDELKLETKLSVLKYDVVYAEKTYERMLEMGDFVANNLKYSYQTIVEEVGEEKAARMFADSNIDIVQMQNICNRWEAILKLLDCWRTLQSIKL